MSAAGRPADADRDALKRAAAEAAVELVEEGMVVGPRHRLDGGVRGRGAGPAASAGSALRRHSDVGANRGAGEGGRHSAVLLRGAPPDRPHDRRRRRGRTRHPEPDQGTGRRLAAREDRRQRQPASRHRRRWRQAGRSAGHARPGAGRGRRLRAGSYPSGPRGLRRRGPAAPVAGGRALRHRRRQPHSRLPLRRPHRRPGAARGPHPPHRRRGRERPVHQPRRSGVRRRRAGRPSPRQRARPSRPSADPGGHGRVGRRQVDRRRGARGAPRLGFRGGRCAASRGQCRQDACRNPADRCGPPALARERGRLDRRSARQKAAGHHHLLRAQAVVSPDRHRRPAGSAAGLSSRQPRCHGRASGGAQRPLHAGEPAAKPDRYAGGTRTGRRSSDCRCRPARRSGCRGDHSPARRVRDGAQQAAREGEPIDARDDHS